MDHEQSFGGHLCPHLQAYDDSRTPAAFPTSANMCFAGKKPTDIGYDHQAIYCLGAYRQCRVFNEPVLADAVQVIDDTHSLEDKLQKTGAHVYDRDVHIDLGFRTRWLIIGIAALIVIILLGVFAFLNRPEQDDQPPVGIIDFISPTPSITFTPSDTPIPSITPTLLASSTPTATRTPTASSTASLTPTPSYTATIPIPTATPTATRTPTSIPTEIGAVNILAITITATPTATFTLVPPDQGDVLVTNTPRPTAQTQEDVLGVLNDISNNYGIGFTWTAEWQPKTVEEVGLYYNYLLSIRDALQATAEYLHYFTRTSDDVLPQVLFRQYFDPAHVAIQRSDEAVGLYGAQTIVLEQEGATVGYVIRVSARGMNDPFPFVREIGFIFNHMLANVPLTDFQNVLGGSLDQAQGGWIPGDGYTGNETLFPTAPGGANEDFKDTFARMFTGRLSPEAAGVRYAFMLDYLPNWLNWLTALFQS